MKTLKTEIQNSVSKLKTEIEEQKLLLEKSQAMAFTPTDTDGNIVSRCGSLMDNEDYLSWVDSGCDKRADKDYECRHLDRDEGAADGLPPEAYDDQCLKFKTRVKRDSEHSFYPKPCRECLTMRSPEGIKGKIKILENTIWLYEKYIQNMEQSSYYENSPERNCSKCAWLNRNAILSFNKKPMCENWKMPVDLNGSCGKFWKGFFPRD